MVLTGAPDLGDLRVQPVFTYDVTRMQDVLEELVGTGDQLKGVRMTISHGASEEALRAFYAADVPPKGAIFAADGFTLFRLPGAPGRRDETLLAGCRGTPRGARLVNVQWDSLPRATGDLARMR